MFQNAFVILEALTKITHKITTFGNFKSSVLFNYATCCMCTHSYEKALKLYEQCASIDFSLSYIEGMAIDYNQLCFCSQLMGDTPSLCKYARKCIIALEPKVFEKIKMAVDQLKIDEQYINMVKLLAIGYLHLSNAYHLEGNSVECDKLKTQSNKLLAKFEIEKIIIPIYPGKSESSRPQTAFKKHSNRDIAFKIPSIIEPTMSFPMLPSTPLPEVNKESRLMEKMIKKMNKQEGLLVNLQSQVGEINGGSKLIMSDNTSHHISEKRKSIEYDYSNQKVYQLEQKQEEQQKLISFLSQKIRSMETKHREVHSPDSVPSKYPSNSNGAQSNQNGEQSISSKLDSDYMNSSEIKSKNQLLNLIIGNTITKIHHRLINQVNLLLKHLRASEMKGENH